MAGKGAVVKWNCLKDCHVEEELDLFCMAPEDRARIQRMVIVTERWIWTLQKDEQKRK